MAEFRDELKRESGMGGRGSKVASNGGLRGADGARMETIAVETKGGKKERERTSEEVAGGQGEGRGVRGGG